MDRFFIPLLSPDQKFFSVDSPDEFHHLAHVLRLRPGDGAEFTDGRGLLVLGTIASMSAGRAEVAVLEAHSTPPATPRIILACAIPKKAKIENIIDKCTQLGVDEILPVMTERTEVVIRDKDAATKCARFEKVAVTAMKQSKRLWKPIIHRPCKFSDLFQRITPETLTLIPWLEGERMSLKEALSRLGKKTTVLCLIGPEGDFSPLEVELAQANGALTVSLGDNVLRVDTAAEMVVGCSRMMLGS